MGGVVALLFAKLCVGLLEQYDFFIPVKPLSLKYHASSYVSSSKDEVAGPWAIGKTVIG